MIPCTRTFFTLCASTLLAALAGAGDGARITYQYDDLGRIHVVTQPDGTTITYEYDPGGNVLSVTTSSKAQELEGLLDFDSEGLPAGTIASELHASVAGARIGPLLVEGSLPSRPDANSTLLFDSAHPTGGDLDLGTPNQTFGGPGIGAGGEAGAPFENARPQGKILILAENLRDANHDGLVDVPDDANEAGMLVRLDFTRIVTPFVPESVSVLELLILDIEADGPPGTVRLYGLGDRSLGVFPLLATGDNGVRRLPIGPPGVGIVGVARMELELNQSGAFDDLVFRLRR